LDLDSANVKALKALEEGNIKTIKQIVKELKEKNNV